MDDLNKWAVYNQLMKSSSVDIFLPQTKYVAKPEIVFTMLNCYKSVLIKPCVGHGGQYIIHIYKIKRETYKIYYYKIGKIYSCTMSHIEMETMILKQLCYRDCIVQRDINLAQHHGTFVTFRICVQKEYNGLWKCSQIYGKYAAKGSTITSIDMGGSIISYDKLQPSCTIDKKQLKVELFDLSIHTAKHLNKMSGYSCICTWYIDVAIDHCGGIWYLDASVYDTYASSYSFRDTCLIKIDQGISLLTAIKNILK